MKYVLICIKKLIHALNTMNQVSGTLWVTLLCQLGEIQVEGKILIF